MSAVRAALAEMVGLMMSGEEPGAGSPWYQRAVAALEAEPILLSDKELLALAEPINFTTTEARDHYGDSYEAVVQQPHEVLKYARAVLAAKGAAK